MTWDHLAARAALYAALDDTPFWWAIRNRADRYIATLRAGGTLYFAGNGGSAATAQHVAAEYIGRFQRERRPYRAIALTTDTSVLTAISNDYGYQAAFARQIAAHCTPADLVVLHSTSGRGPAIFAAAQEAARVGCPLVALVGRDGGLFSAGSERLTPLAQHDAIVVPSGDTALIQEAHLAIEHIICGLVESALEGE